MSERERETELARSCPRCATLVEAKLLEGDDGVTWLWRCPCGWAGARTESGVVDRRHVNALVDHVLRKSGAGPG